MHCPRCVENWQFSESSTIALNAIQSQIRDKTEALSERKINDYSNQFQTLSLFFYNVYDAFYLKLSSGKRLRRLPSKSFRGISSAQVDGIELRLIFLIIQLVFDMSPMNIRFI